MDFHQGLRQGSQYPSVLTHNLSPGFHPLWVRFCGAPASPGLVTLLQSSLLPASSSPVSLLFSMEAPIGS
eukprot:1147422-Pelagomonas_calceolata.AAC.1